jgi:hypothetical protein
MIIGYSFWGFLGPGITDTPDGGRSHRRAFIDAIAARGHRVVLLQPDRDRLEAGDDLGRRYTIRSDLPKLDVLFLEWRWPIPGRNTTACEAPGHTCDLHRQSDLVGHYTLNRGTPTIIWDKDRKLPAASPLRRHANMFVCEAALAPEHGAASLLFPLDDDRLDAADPGALAAQRRPLALAYAGNQYDRDDAFDMFFAAAAADFPHQIAGKWTDIDRWPHVNFTGRIPFPEVAKLYGRSLATVLLLPERYAAVGQMTQRIFEAVLAGCLPITPVTIRGAHRFTPHRLHVTDGRDVVNLLHELCAIVGTPAHRLLLAECLRRLDLFRLSAQTKAFEAILTEAVADRKRTG